MTQAFSRRECIKRLSQFSALGSTISLLSSNTSPAEEDSRPQIPRIIDPHVHVWKNDPRYPWAQETIEPPKRDALPETLLELMKANGVSGTVLIQVIYFRWDNSYLFDVIKKHPRSFRGVCRINPESPSALTDLARLSKRPGFAGVRLSPGPGPEGDWINGPLMGPLWNLTRNLGSTMTILTETTRLPDVARLIGKFPDLDVVIDHMADCPIDKRDELQKLLDLARFPNVYIKISHMWKVSKQNYPYADTHDMVHRIYDKFGPRRLMWGTDWPMVEDYCGYAKALSLVRDELKFLNTEDKEWVLGKSIERLWLFPL